MKDTDILAAAMKESGIKQADLATHFGVNKSTVSTNLRRDRMSIDIFVSYLDAMGFSVVIGKKNKEEFVPMWELEQE